MIRSGDWPPTNRGAIRFMVGMLVGILIGYGLGRI